MAVQLALGAQRALAVHPELPARTLERGMEQAGERRMAAVKPAVVDRAVQAVAARRERAAPEEPPAAAVSRTQVRGAGRRAAERAVEPDRVASTPIPLVEKAARTPELPTKRAAAVASKARHPRRPERRSRGWQRCRSSVFC
jgi:hypothetical protein